MHRRNSFVMGRAGGDNAGAQTTARTKAWVTTVQLVWHDSETGSATLKDSVPGAARNPTSPRHIADKAAQTWLTPKQDMDKTQDCLILPCLGSHWLLSCGGVSRHLNALSTVCVMPVFGGNPCTSP